MCRKKHRTLLELLEAWRDRAGRERVRIHKDNRVDSSVAEEVSDREWLQRVDELEGVVRTAHLLEPRDVDRTYLHHVEASVDRSPEVGASAVDEQDGESRSWLMLEQRLAEHARGRGSYSSRE